MVPSDRNRIGILFRPTVVESVCYSIRSEPSQHVGPLGIHFNPEIGIFLLWLFGARAGAHIYRRIILSWSSLYHILVENMLKIKHVVRIYYIVRTILLKIQS